MVSNIDIRHEAAPVAIATDHGTGSNQGIPHGRAVNSRGRGRHAPDGTEAAEAGHGFLGVYPQARPVAPSLDAQTATTVHQAPVAAHENRGDVSRRQDG